MLNILAIQNGTGSRFYRLNPQLKFMQERGHKVKMIPHNDSKLYDSIMWSDVVIFQMVFSKELVGAVKSLGKKAVFECDDLLHRVPKTHYEYENLKGIKGLKFYYKIFDTIRRCDGFISTNKNLQNMYGWMAKKSLAFDNYIDFTHWMKQGKENKSDEIRLLWAGSTSHTGDLKMIQPVIKKILTKYKNVKFIYIGHGGVKSEDLTAKFIYGEDLFKDLPDNRESMLGVPASVWPNILATLNADIAIAPLEKNYFNKFKSQCKFLEYSINRIPAVYSGWFYKDVEDGKNGLLANNEKEWVDKISYLIENAKERKQMGMNAFGYVINNKNIMDYLSKWEQFITNL